MFNSSYASGDLRLVDMNEVRFLPFDRSRRRERCIGTANLNSCTGVVIVCPAGVIMGHIAPYSDRELENPMHHVHQMMDMMENYYRTTRGLSFRNVRPHAFLVYAIHEGEVALPDQVDAIQRRIESLGVRNVRQGSYVARMSSDPLGPGDITMVYDIGDSMGRLFCNNSVLG